MSSHCCIEAECKGDKYHQLYIRCSNCNDPNFLECIANNPGIFELLMALKIINSMGDIMVSKLESTKVHTSFKAIFSKHSSIKIICDRCKENEVKSKAIDEKFKNDLINDLSAAQKDFSNLQLTSKKLAKENRQKDKEYGEIEIENLMLHDKLAQLEDKLDNFKPDAEFLEADDGSLNVGLRPPLPPKAHTQIQSIKNPVNNITGDSHNNQLSIYVSKFCSSTECSEISQHILKHTALDNGNLFTVTKLLKRKANMKIISFVSFMITASNQSVYDAIMEQSVWGPDFTAIPFNVNHQKKQKRPQIGNQNQSEPKNRLKKPDAIKSTTKNIQSRDNLVNKKSNVVPLTKTSPVIINQTKQLMSGNSVINKKAELQRNTVQNPAMFPFASQYSYLPYQYSYFNPNMNYLPSPSNQMPQVPQSNFHQGYNQLPYRIPPMYPAYPQMLPYY